MKQYIPIPLCCALLSCQDSSQEKRQAELEHARQLAEIEIEKAKKLADYQENKEKEKAEALRQEKAKAIALQEKFNKSLAGQKIQVIKKLYYERRMSHMDNSKYVLVIKNPSKSSADVYLRCTASGGRKRVFQISVPANGRKEFGVFEGWPFSYNDTFEIIYNNTIYAKKVIGSL